MELDERLWDSCSHTAYTPLLLSTLPLSLFNGNTQVFQVNGKMRDMAFVLVSKLSDS